MTNNKNNTTQRLDNLASNLAMVSTDFKAGRKTAMDVLRTLNVAKSEADIALKMLAAVIQEKRKQNGNRIHD